MKIAQKREQSSHVLKDHYISLGRDEGRLFHGGRPRCGQVQHWES